MRKAPSLPPFSDFSALEAWLRVCKTHSPCVRKGCRLCAEGTGWPKLIFTFRAWVFIAGNAVVYTCADSRGGTVAKDALKGFTGRYLSDRYAGYAFLALRAFCLGHLRRATPPTTDRLRTKQMLFAAVCGAGGVLV